MGMFEQFKDVMDRAKEMAGQARGKAEEMAKKADSASGGKLSDAMGQARSAVGSMKDRAAGSADAAKEKTGETNQWYGSQPRPSQSRPGDTYHSEPS
jgi:uncharacterized protein YjbJ (UPF0337 family)